MNGKRHWISTTWLLIWAISRTLWSDLAAVLTWSDRKPMNRTPSLGKWKTNEEKTLYKSSEFHKDHEIFDISVLHVLLNPWFSLSGNKFICWSIFTSSNIHHELHTNGVELRYYWYRRLTFQTRNQERHRVGLAAKPDDTKRNQKNIRSIDLFIKSSNLASRTLITFVKIAPVDSVAASIDTFKLVSFSDEWVVCAWVVWDHSGELAKQSSWISRIPNDQLKPLNLKSVVERDLMLLFGKRWQQRTE